METQLTRNEARRLTQACIDDLVTSLLADGAMPVAASFIGPPWRDDPPRRWGRLIEAIAAGAIDHDDAVQALELCADIAQAANGEDWSDVTDRFTVICTTDADHRDHRDGVVRLTACATVADAWLIGAGQ